MTGAGDWPEGLSGSMDEEPVRDEPVRDEAVRNETAETAPTAEPAPEAATSAAEPAASAPTEPEDPVVALARERDEYLDTLRRVQADFENYKKRIVRQQTEHLERAAEGIVTKLLPALDALEMARSHHDPDSEAGKALGAVHSSLFDVLSKEGLEPIAPLGSEFDPNEADAVMHEPADEGDNRHEVVEVLRPGYRWRGRVVRPAMVKVKS
ncbi:MAG TPA: nucleotide exchange factor GrpE [Acidimicrobiales bacterium]|nr:nucleotide exchange factor GrpE [Acidimicrobiales bacterium]